MDTCLDCLWELLRGSVFDTSKIDEEVTNKDENWIHKSKEAEKCVQIIDKFFFDLQNIKFEKTVPISMPQHLEVFRISLSEFHIRSMIGIQEGAMEAKEMSHDCNLCAVCRGCAEKFYDAVVKGDSTERALPADLEHYFMLPAQMHYYQNGLNGSKERRRLNNKLLCLKGFSSSTPTIHSATFSSDCAGGGLYINYQGVGIVVDPGIGFVKSMHKHGIFITDINVIIITHDHLDHNADAAVLSSLLHDYNTYTQRKNKIVKEIFNTKSDKPHEIIWIADGETKNKLSKQVENLIPLRKYLGRQKQIFSRNNDIKLSAVQTEHIRGNKETYGIKISLKYNGITVNLGYTSDTGYFTGLADYYRDVDLLIFNISDIYKKDVKGIKDKHSHLGYNGSLKLLQESGAKVAIASEFCCTNGDIRVKLVKILKEEISTESKCDVFPGEIGLNIDLPSLKVECCICKNKVFAEDVKIVAPEKEYERIQYICGNCI